MSIWKIPEGGALVGDLPSRRFLHYPRIQSLVVVSLLVLISLVTGFQEWPPSVAQLATAFIILIFAAIAFSFARETWTLRYFWIREKGIEVACVFQ